MKRIFLLVFVIYTCAQSGHSQPGSLDRSFGNNGIVATDMGASYNYNFDSSSVGRQVLLQPGGGIYVIVNAPVLNGTVITKRLQNGTADLSYGDKGFSVSVPVNDPHGAIQADGKIVVVGWTYRHFISAVSLARYNVDGSLDNTFNRYENEILDFGTNLSIAIQNDGKIVVAGAATNGDEDVNFALARFNADGTHDTTFGNQGKQLTDFGLKLPADRGGNYPESDYATSIAIQKDGKVVAAGYAFNYGTSTYDFAISRYNSDGSLDKSFDSDGRKVTGFGNTDDYINAVAIQNDGKIVVAGSTGSDFSLARYNSNGSLDKTFDLDGKQTTDFGTTEGGGFAVAVKNDGKIVVTGYVSNGTNNDFAIAEYNTNGSLDKTFNKTGKKVKDLGSSDDYSNSVAIQNDGKIIIEGYTSSGGHSDFTLTRLNINGSEDGSFDGRGKLNEIPKQGFTDYTCVAVQKDKKIVAAGYSWNGENFDFAVARYNTDGSLDKTFSDDGKQVVDFASSDDEAAAIAIQSDGKIVLAGSTNSDFALVRFNIDGSLDKSFNKNGKLTLDYSSTNDAAKSVAIQSDGKIVVAGESNLDFAVARINTDGSPDKSFSIDGKVVTDFNSSNDYGYAVAIQKDGKIVVAGSTLTVDGLSNAEFALVRYNKNGSLDHSFDNDGKQTSSFGYMYNFAYSLAIQDDGKILAAGYAGDPSLFATARYNINGSLDSSFSEDGLQTTDAGFDYSVAKSISVVDSNKILLAGYVWKDNGLSFATAAYTADGKLDQSFGKNGIQVIEASTGDNFINAIVVSNNKFYAAGTGRDPGDLGVVARYLLEENRPPAVSIAIPGNIVKYNSPATFKIIATATDGDGTITKVEFYNGANLLHIENLIPYGFVWRNVPAGNYTITAKATDNSGNVTVSNSIRVTVQKPNVLPLVNVVNPVNGVTNGGSNLHLEADAKDPDGRIVRVEFYNGSTLLRTEYQYPYTYTWINVAPGTYNITAVAVDNFAGHTTSAPVTVEVKAANKMLASNKPLGEDLSGFNLKLAPNPATNIVSIYPKGLQQGRPLTVSVISSSGVVEKVLYFNNFSNNMQIDVRSLISGVHYIKFENAGKTFYKPFVKL